MPDPPKTQQGGAGQTAAASAQTQARAPTGTEDALAFVDQLKTYTVELERELRSYGDPNVVGRDTQALVASFNRIHQCELQIAQSMGINWSPQNSS